MSPSTSMNLETQLLFDLVSARSPSGSERPAAEVFERYASELGYQASIDEVGNAIAHRGASASDASMHIVLLGHIDTVPGDIPVRIEDGILHGRGSVDAKGPLSAMLVAASRIEIPDGVCVTVAGAVGEEASGSIGARYLVHQWSPDACIIGEPSAWDGVTLGYKGRLLITATAHCTNAHSAGQSLSACDEVHQWWNSVLMIVDEFNVEPTRAFDQVQATVLSMHSTNDGIDQRAVLSTGFRLPPAMNPDQLRARLEEIESKHITLRFEGAEVAHATDRNDPVVRALSTAIRTHGGQPHPKLKTGTADLNVVAPVWKCPIAAYGPGDSSLDHTPIEHLHLKEYSRSILILETALGLLISSVRAQ